MPLEGVEKTLGKNDDVDLKILDTSQASSSHLNLTFWMVKSMFPKRPLGPAVLFSLAPHFYLKPWMHILAQTCPNIRTIWCF